MLESIIYWLAIWFNVGLLSQVFITAFYSVLQKRWLFKWSESGIYFKAGCFGFLSAFNAFLMLLRILSIITSPRGDDGDEDMQEGIYIAGLTEEELVKVEKFVKELVDARPKEEAEDDK